MADRAVPGVRGAARDGPLPRSRERPPRRCEARRTARRMAGGPAPDHGVPGPVVARRRDVRGTRRSRRRPVCDRAARGRGAADPPANRLVPLPAAATERLQRRRSWRRGRHGIEPFLSAGDDVYAFFRHDEVGRGAELALALPWRSCGGDPRIAGPQARSPSAGPNITSSSSRSSMSWNRVRDGRPRRRPANPARPAASRRRP